MNPPTSAPSADTPPAASRRTRSWRRVVGWTLLVIVVLVGGLAVFAATFDWNRARPWIEQRVAKETGRTLHIDGNLELEWHRGGADQGGWRAWVPWPQLTAHDLRFSNADWSKTGEEMARLSTLSVSLNPLPLMQHTVRITELELDGPQVVLERLADGRNNWTFDRPESKEPADNAMPWRLELDRLVLKKGGLHYIDEPLKIDLTVAVDSIEPQDGGPYGVRWTLKGKYQRATLEGEGRAGAVLDLRNNEHPFPIQAKVRAGRTRAEVEGTLLQPTSLAGLDLKVSLAGQSMADLYNLTGVTLPKTPPYKTQGRLIGRLEEGNKSWTYREFTGQVGRSDIAGTLQYLLRPTRPMLRGKVHSKLLRFEDLGPLIGAGPAASQSEFEEKKERQPGDRVLPVADFDTKSWGAMDADVVFDADRIVADEDLPINSLHAALKLDNRVLSLTPLNFGVAGGTLGSDIKLDASSGTIAADTRMRIKALKIAKLFPKLESTHASLGTLNGSVALSGKGNDISTLLGDADGEVRALIGQGTFSKLVLEAMGLNIGNVIMTQLFGDEQVQLNCLAARFDVKDGLMTTRAFVLDTSETRVEVTGTVNLKSEALSMDMVPRNKQLRLLSLRAPLHVRGNFANPNVSIDKPTVALKLGAAAALFAAAPITALLPLTSLDVGEEPDTVGCRDLLRAAAGKAQAPKAKAPSSAKSAQEQAPQNR
ncbi:AsmA family protein [Variovorax sp.]|uniref:AsmA family protein n=1 Tax=Variovorax sp. TaxID=1871043 RepID=UPI002D4EB514|nr:AsmA family protein [Variovorax sp.]HYP83600.1 AsmA family protein [Variovorax sp.]